MKRNKEANCGNCPLGTPENPNSYRGISSVRCHGHRKGSPREDHVCWEHPNYWGFETSTCGQCAWAMSGDENASKEARELSDKWVICRDCNCSWVLLNSPACPAFRPREDKS
jgi:hypothetical protein